MRLSSTSEHRSNCCVLPFLKYFVNLYVRVYSPPPSIGIDLHLPELNRLSGKSKSHHRLALRACLR